MLKNKMTKFILSMDLNEKALGEWEMVCLVGLINTQSVFCFLIAALRLSCLPCPQGGRTSVSVDTVL